MIWSNTVLARKKMDAKILRSLTAVLLFGVAAACAQTTAKQATRSAPAAPTATPQRTAPDATGVAQRGATRPAPATKVSQLKYPPLPDFHPAQPKRIELANGAVIFLMEDHELPLIDFSAEFHGGARSEPASKVGLVDIYGQTWRTGGTSSKTGDEVDDLLEAHAAKLETSGDIDSTAISGNCLKGDFDTVFDLMIDFMQHPEFREDKIELAERQLDTSIARRNDSESGIAERESTRLAYGKDNPYARIPEYATVSAVTRQDLLDWHHRFIHPNNMIFGIVGDFDSAQMEVRLRNAFGSLPRGPQYKAPEIEFHEPKPGVYFVEKEDVNQSQIRMVALGTTRRNPDYFAISVMNEAFGGGFSSRLFSRIRTMQGLAYAVGGSFGSSFDHPGIFRLVMSTKSATTAQAVQSLWTEVDNASKEPFTDEEVRRAKDNLLNAFVFNFDSKDKVLRERMTYEFYGYPPDFLEQYRAGVEKTTVDDVNRVARKYLNRSVLATLVVGNSKEFGRSLSTFGAVTPIDITIPETGASGAEAAATPKPAQSTPQAKALLAKALDWLGGKEKLASVKSWHYTYAIAAKTPQGELQLNAESWAMLPDSAKQIMTTPFGEMTTVVGPSGGYAMRGTQTAPLPKTSSEEFLRSLRRSSFYVAQHADDPAYIFYTGDEKAAGGTAVLNISGEGQDFAWFVDPNTGAVSGSRYQGSGQTGPVVREETYSNTKLVDGIKIPGAISITENGHPSASVTIDKYEINPKIDPSVFAAPQPGSAPRGQAAPSPKQ